MDSSYKYHSSTYPEHIGSALKILLYSKIDFFPNGIALFLQYGLTPFLLLEVTDHKRILERVLVESHYVVPVGEPVDVSLQSEHRTLRDSRRLIHTSQDFLESILLDEVLELVEVVLARKIDIYGYEHWLPLAWCLMGTSLP